ncbi:MAG: hypothetical protein H7X91_02005 [Burkholderiales bacterium]|nr:hypothetical protein [Burkholderiales bacterium]
MDNYELLLDGHVDLLRRLSPDEPGGDHCVEAADAVHDFLETGVVAPVDSGWGTTYRLHADVLAGFRRVDLVRAIERLESQGHGHHIVVRAVRAQPGHQSPHHYFVLANVRGLVIVFDAYGHLVVQGRQRILDYATLVVGVPPGSFEYAARGFDVEARNSLDGLFAP